MKDHYVKDYKEKELRQYILAYLLITVASIALHTDFSADNENLLDTLLKMAAIDIWVSGLSVLVVILNEMWPDAMKTEIVYGSMPSDTIFSEIAAEENEFCFDVDVAKENVLNGHKSLLESELAQMYIRHAIKDGNMCPYTGAQCKTPRPIEKDEDGNAPGATDTQKDNAAFQSAYGVRTAQECSQCPIMQKSCAIQSSCPLQ